MVVENVTKFLVFKNINDLVSLCGGTCVNLSIQIIAVISLEG